MKIKDYANQNPILTGDKVLGTAAADNATKNFTVDELVNFVEDNITGYTGSFTSAFGKYTIFSGSNSRAGEFVTSWNGTTTSYYDNSTVDIGNTSAITFTSAIVSGQIQINTGASTPSGWQVKMLATFMQLAYL